MIKVSVFYPYAEGKRFDMAYYCNSHMPMVQQRLGPACKGIAVESGLASAAPGSPPPYVAMGHMYFDSLEEFQAAYAANMDEFVADVPRYTDIQPVVQVSEVRV